MSNSEAHKRAERMAKIIAANSLKSVMEGDLHLYEWMDGRASACALMYPSIETLSAANQIRFLSGSYARRHPHEPS